MKKTYINPSLEVVTIKNKGQLLTASNPTPNFDPSQNSETMDAREFIIDGEW